MKLREEHFMPHKKTERNRNITFHFCASQEEVDLIHERMAAAGVINRAAYLRRMAIKGYHINLDLTVVRELTSQLRHYTNNLNQLCRCAVETQSPFTTELEALRQKNDSLWDGVKKILEGLAKIK
jgi:hypothetical protein